MMFSSGYDRVNNNSLPIFKEGDLRAGLIVEWSNRNFPDRLGQKKTVDYLFRCNGGCALCFKFTDGSDYNVSSWSVVGEALTENEAKEKFFTKFPDCPEARFLRLEIEIEKINKDIRDLKNNFIEL